MRSIFVDGHRLRDAGVHFGTATGDLHIPGFCSAGLGSYVFFNAATFPNPASAATAFAVLYLPYSVIGPFAGVFIDRWSRRQIMVWSALIRSVFVAATASPHLLIEYLLLAEFTPGYNAAPINECFAKWGLDPRGGNRIRLE